MENKIMMPASYNVLSCEEMTYTEGGAPSVRLSLHGCGPATLRLSASTPAVKRARRITTTGHPTSGAISKPTARAM